MKEFASALLVGMVRSELARRGIDPAVPPIPLAEGKVPLALKRDLLARVAAQHGLLPLMEVGRGISRLPPDPAVTALARAADPHDAFARWQRLERFVHSRHRIAIEDAGGRHLVIRHVGPNGAEPPMPGEDALILGVTAELCRFVGAVDLRITMLARDGTGHVILEGGWFAEPDKHDVGDTGLWRFEWKDIQPTSRVSVPAASPNDRTGPPDMAAIVTATLSEDLGRKWSLGALARLLALSERTLQRRLTAAGASLPALVRAARVRAAGDLLIDSNHSVASIGFACGFTDQPHFTRLFRRQTAMTPAAYRRAFAE